MNGKIPDKSDLGGMSLHYISELIISNRNSIVRKFDQLNTHGKLLLGIRHRNPHSREEHFVYDRIGKAISQSEVLFQHQNIQTLKQLFECNKCGKAFHEETSLPIRENTHGRST